MKVYEIDSFLFIVAQADLVRAPALSHSEWMVPSSNPGEGRNYFYSRVGDGGLSIICIDGYDVAIKNL